MLNFPFKIYCIYSVGDFECLNKLAVFIANSSQDSIKLQFLGKQEVSDVLWLASRALVRWQSSHLCLVSAINKNRFLGSLNITGFQNSKTNFYQLTLFEKHKAVACFPQNNGYYHLLTVTIPSLSEIAILTVSQRIKGKPYISN